MASDFPSYLATALRSAEMTQADLARAIGRKPPTVSKWLSGDRRPDVATVERVAETLHVPPAEALEHADYPEAAARYYGRMQPNPAADLRRAMSAFPLRPVVRGLFVELVQRVSEEQDRDWRAAYRQAWDYATQAMGASEPMNREQWEAHVAPRFERKFAELMGGG